jgi:hypothetical protein
MYAKTLCLMQAATKASTRAITSKRPDATPIPDAFAGPAPKAGRHVGAWGVARAGRRMPAGGALAVSTRGKGA